MPKKYARLPKATTGLWYVRLCQAVLNSRTSDNLQGKLSGPFNRLPEDLRIRAQAALSELPEPIELVSLRQLGPKIAGLRSHHSLNLLSIEAVAAAKHLEATLLLDSPSPLLLGALDSERVTFEVRSAPQ